MSRGRNDGGLTSSEKYTIVRSNDYYATRLSSGGLLQIYNIDNHNLLFFLFGSTSNPFP